MNPVSGDFVTTANFAVVVSGVPTSGAVAKISGLPAASGSTPRGAYSSSRLVPSPTPPRQARRRSSSRARYTLRPEPRSTCSRRPQNPSTVLAPRVRRHDRDDVAGADTGGAAAHELESVAAAGIPVREMRPVRRDDLAGEGRHFLDERRKGFRESGVRLQFERHLAGSTYETRDTEQLHRAGDHGAAVQRSSAAAYSPGVFMLMKLSPAGSKRRISSSWTMRVVTFSNRLTGRSSPAASCAARTGSTVVR